MKVTISAWNNNRYISLAELLLLIGYSLIGLKWYVRISEVAPEPGAEQLESIDPDEPMDLFNLLHLVTPNIQIIDGEIIACNSDGADPVLVLRAVDSTSWDIETCDKEVELIVQSSFPRAQRFD